MDRVETTSVPTEVPQSPLCRDLRSKKYFFLETMPMAASDILGPDNHCWCRRTMQVMGPDGKRVHPTSCGGDRACYTSQFE